MFFEERNHRAYEKTQQVKTAGNRELLISRSQLIQSDFSNFILQIELPMDCAAADLAGAEFLCYYGDVLVRAQIGGVRSSSFSSSVDGSVYRFGFVCKKLVFVNNSTLPHGGDCVDYIIPFSKIELFDNFTECLNGYLIRDSISITGKKASWNLKNLISVGEGGFSVSPYILGKDYSFSNHLILSVNETFSSDFNDEAYNIASLLQLALGSLALPACRVIRRGEQIIELKALHTPNKIPCFWSPLGRPRGDKRGRIKQYIETALGSINKGKLGKRGTWRAILATYATMNMRHVHLEHRLLFSYQLLDTLHMTYVSQKNPQVVKNHQTLQVDTSELERDIVDVFHKHNISKAEKAAKLVIENLGKRGQQQGNVPSFKNRVKQLYEKYSCPLPIADDLEHRNDIVHEGCLKIEDTGEGLRLMTRVFNSVTSLLFKIFQYEDSLDLFPEDEWQVVEA